LVSCSSEGKEKKSRLKKKLLLTINGVVSFSESIVIIKFKAGSTGRNSVRPGFDKQIGKA